MTNKTKKGTSKKQTKANKEATKEVAASPEYSGYTNFTRAQLASLVFLFVGFSKVMELSAAHREGFEDPKTCLSYLGEGNGDVCSNPSFSSLILAKYYSSLSLVGYLVAGMVLLWNSEVLFQRFMTCFTLSPVATTALATIGSQSMLERTRVWHLLVVCSVLYATIAPQNFGQIPFVADRKFVPNTMSSVSLMLLAAFSLMEVLSVVASGNDRANALLVTVMPLPAAAKSIINFWIVDKFSMVLLYCFALIHLPTHAQKGFLFFTAFIKAFEVYVHISKMEEPFRNNTLIETATLVSAVASAVGWFV